MNTEGFKVLFPAREIARRVEELGAEISRDWAGRTPLMVAILKGSVFFVADLLRAVTVPLHLDFIAISSLEGKGDQEGAVRILKDLDLPVRGRPVIIIEDIIDTGLTAGYLVRAIEARSPGSLEICTLLDRRVRRLVPLPLRYVGFEVPDLFLVGYGLDYGQEYRNLPYLAIFPEGRLRQEEA